MLLFLAAVVDISAAIPYLERNYSVTVIIMSIIFNENTKNFQLDSKSASYVIGIFEGGYLLHLYYGAKIPAGEDFSNEYFRGYQASFIPYNKEVRDAGYPGFYPGNAPMEYPTNGVCDYRTSALSILNKDGNTVTDIRYESHKIYRGKPRLSGLPSLYADENSAETLELIARDPYTNAVVTLYYTVFDQLDAIVRSVSIKNDGENAFQIDSAASLCLDLHAMDYDFIHLWGQHNQERALSITPLAHGSQSISSKRGASGHFHNPFAALATNGTDEQHGEVYAVNLVYSGNFTISAEVDAGCTTRLVAGINDHDFLWEVKPGDTFQTPECVLVYSGAGLGEMSRTFHRLYLDHLIPANWAYTKRPLLINSWEAAYFDFDTDKLIAFAERAKEYGIDMLVMDDGWFGHRDNDLNSLGDWYIYEKKLDLKRLTDTVHAMGLKFGIWYEPEMISPDSDLFRAHPDWHIHVPGRPASEGRQQYIIDFSRQDVRDNIFAQMSSVLDNYNIDYVKWDFNRNMTEAGSALLDAAHGLEFYHRYMLGLYDFLDKFVKKYPNLLLESCSGGGGRFDAGWLAYSPQIWASDNTNPIDRCRIQYGTSLCYPASTMGAHVSHKDAISDYTMRGCVAMAGTFGYEMDPRTFTDDEKLLVKQQVANYHKYYDTIHYGDLYRIVSPYDGNQSRSIWSYVSRDKKTALLTVATFQRVFNQNLFVRMQGLDPNKIYFCEALNLRASGARLMNAGINLCDQLRQIGQAKEFYFEEVSEV